MNPEFGAALRARVDAAGLTVTEDVVGKLAEYYDLLAFWNRRINLTALTLDRFPDPSIDRLLIEPMIAATLVPADSSLAMLDLGSGGGSPAIPLKIIRSSLHLTMVESRERKASFLREATRRLGLDRTDVLAVRFSELPPPPFPMDLVTARAVRLDPGLVRVLNRWLAPSGSVFLFGPAEVPADWPFQQIQRLPLQGSAHPLSVWTHPKTKGYVPRGTFLR